MATVGTLSLAWTDPVHLLVADGPKALRAFGGQCFAKDVPLGFGGDGGDFVYAVGLLTRLGSSIDDVNDDDYHYAADYEAHDNNEVDHSKERVKECAESPL
jgi:hypothetical protein